MHQLVKDSPVWTLSTFLRFDGYVVEVCSGLKITRDFCRLALIERSERFEGIFVFEDDDICLDCQTDSVFRKQPREQHVILFELHRRLSYLTLAGIADELEMFRAHANPFLSGPHARFKRTE